MRKTFLSIIFLLILLLVPTMVFATETASLPDAVDGVITLTEDIVLEDTAVINSTVTLDLNGHTISNTTDIWNTTTKAYALISVREGGNLTITGEGTLQAKENDCFAAMVQDGGKLTIDSGKYVGNIQSIYIMNEGEVIINGGEYSIQQLSSDVETDKYRYTLNCNDQYYVAGKAKFTVTGGKFYNFNPENNLSEGEGTNYLAKGYKVVQNGNYYEVVVDEEYNFKKALSNGGTVKLDKDIVLTDTAVINSTVILDLNGHTISNTTDIWNTTTKAYALISVREGGNLTITGEGTLQAKENDCFAAMVQDGGKLTIDSGKYVGNIQSIYIMNEGEVIINGGEYSIQQLSSDVETDKYRYTLNCNDQYYVAGKAKFTVTGGKFYNFNPANNLSEGEGTNYLADGCRVVKNGDWYTVYKENTITVEEVEGGTVSATLTKAIVGETVELTATPDEGYELKSLNVITVADSAVELTGGKFVMPDMGVIVIAEFTEIPAEPVLPEEPEEEVDYVIPGVSEEEAESAKETITSSIKQKNPELAEDIANALQNGEKVTIAVEINKLEKDNVEEEEKQMILQTVKENQTVHQYLDISVAVRTEDKLLGNVSQLTDKIKVFIDVPENLIKDGRKFFILKLHDGEVEQIEGKLNGTKLEIEVDQFSTFALAYEDEKVLEDGEEDNSGEAPGESIEEPKDEEKEETKEEVNVPNTGDNIVLYIALALIAVAGIVLTKKVNTRKNKN